jgi:hypothetical protein
VRRLSAGVVALIVFASAPAAAQSFLRPEDLSGWSVVPVFQMLGVYEDNLLVAGPTTQGPFARVTPSLDTRYRGPLGSFHVGYSFDSERHGRDLAILDDVFARQVGIMSFESKPAERTTISGHARYMSTRRPEEVLEDTGLVVDVRRTTGVVANIAAERKTSEASRTNIGYTLTVDDFGQATEARPGARSVLHAATAAFTLQKSERASVGVEYTGKLLNGEERTFRAVTEGLFWAHSLAVRWTLALTPHATLSLTAGPRFAQTVPAVIDTPTAATVWDRQPEARASLTYRDKDRQLSIAYGRTQEIGFGASGFIDTESLEARASRVLGRRLEFSARPGVYRNTLAGQRANSYRLETVTHYFITTFLSVDGVFSYRYQDRALALSDLTITTVAASRKRTRAAVGLTIQRPIRVE